ARRLLRWEAGGALFTVLAGSALHFAFEWSGGWRPVALVAAVNESTWEHLKLAFWPALLWTGLEAARLPRLRRALWPAKGLALLFAAGLIVAVFESYTAILKDNVLVLDIGTFVLSVIAGHALSAWLLIGDAPRGWLAAAGRVLLVAQVVAYATFTFLPPDHPLFTDPRDGRRGLPPADHSSSAAAR
ncbi:MAG: DUF6512 family protein, partial [Pseudomonadota bacterium]